MLAIAFNFLAGRYHATPWGRHVNEADVAWPPDLWRISRAFIAVWHRKLDPQVFPRQQLHALLAQLAEADPPSFRLPEVAIHAHTRHYMPGRGDKKTLIFDAFVRVASDDPLIVAWPNLQLPAPETALLDALLENLGFLGRAESWVEGSRASEPVQFNCVPSGEDLDIGTGEITGEIVRLLAPNRPISYDQFRADKLTQAGIKLDVQGRHPAKLKGDQSKLTATLPLDWVDAIGVDTGDLQAAGWSAPPAAVTLSYRRPLHALTATAVTAKRKAFTRKDGPPITTARFAIYGKPLPRIEDAVRIGEALRRAAMGRAKIVLQTKTLPPELSGHDLDDGNRHGHAFWLPEDFDHASRSDGLIDHLLVHAPGGLSSDAVRVLTSLQSLRRDEGEPLRLMLEGIGSTQMLGGISHYVGESKVWRSVTPYLHPWHRKDDFGYVEQIQRECRLRGWAKPQVSIETHIAIGGDRRVRPIQFHRFRRKRGITQPDRLGTALRLEFENPVSGPLALGYGCHFGLGLFAPIR